MKLIGSKMEADYRRDLISLQESFLRAESKLEKVLKLFKHPSKGAQIVDYIPEQGQDIFVVLINGSYLVSIEIDRYDGAISPILEKYELKNWMHGQSRMQQLKMAVAMELANES